MTPKQLCQYYRGEVSARRRNLRGLLPKSFLERASVLASHGGSEIASKAKPRQEPRPPKIPHPIFHQEGAEAQSLVAPAYPGRRPEPGSRAATPSEGCPNKLFRPVVGASQLPPHLGGPFSGRSYSPGRLPSATIDAAFQAVLVAGCDAFLPARCFDMIFMAAADYYRCQKTPRR